MNGSWRDQGSALSDLEQVSDAMPSLYPASKLPDEPDKRRLRAPGKPERRHADRLYREMQEIFDNPPE